MKEGNSSAESIDCWKGFSCICCPLILPFIYWKTRTVFHVEANNFAMVITEDKKNGRQTELYGHGYHVLGYFNRLQGIYSLDRTNSRNLIESEVGDLIIAKVN